jgi:hypothetical protein
MKALRNSGKTLASIAAILLLLVVTMAPAFAADKTYNIKFAEGSHGKVSIVEGPNATQQTDSVTEICSYGDQVDLSKITYTVETGYYFTGWSPDVNTTATESTTYVAQYARIINQAVYHVRYIDNYGNELATQKAAITEKGTNVTEFAVPVDGYVVDAASKTVNVDEPNGVEIVFTYTSAASLTTTTNVITVVLPGGATVATTGGVTTGTAAAAGTAGAGAAAGTTTPAAGQNVANQQGQTTTVDENGTPLANQDVSDNNNGVSPWVYAGIGAGLIIIAAAVAAIIVKRKKQGM